MIRKQEFFNIECDYCGAMLDEETWLDDREATERFLNTNYHELNE